MGKTLLIAEKPSLMRDLQATYQQHKNEIPYDIDFTALAGHICCYSQPFCYPEKGWDNKKWDQISLPMIPEKWKIEIIKDRNQMYSDLEKKIQNNKYDTIIVATDADREGNLIYYLLEQKMNLSSIKSLRLWVHDLTDKAILNSYKSMKDFHTTPQHKNLTSASILRSRFDWLIGMNITIAASVKSKSLMKVGRVKTPTLKLVYDNSMAIENFKPETSYLVDAYYKQGFVGTMFDNDGDIEFKTEKLANDFLNNLGKTATISEVDKKTFKTAAPALYKLSDLQVDGNKYFGYSADKVLSLTQSLYETHKLVSYPRCDCRCVSSVLASDFGNLLKPVGVLNGLASYVNKISEKEMALVRVNKKYVNDDEVNKNSHTALIPTGKMPDLAKLSSDELNILTLIYKRFLAVFLPNLVEDKTVIITKNNNHLFKSTGKIVKDPGFTVLYDVKLEDNVLPDVKKGDVVNVDKFSVETRTTAPETRLTQGTLIALMENIQKRIKDNKLKDVMKESKGIGTQATRGAIITSLIKDEYMEAKKGKGKAEGLYITEKGKAYVENLNNFSIISPEYTAEWETKLKAIESGEMDQHDFNNQMKAYISQTIDEISKHAMKSSGSQGGNSGSGRQGSKNMKSIGKCPKCGGDVLVGDKGYYCSNYKNGCKIGTFKNILNEKITEKDFKDLLDNKEIKKKLQKNDKSWEQKLRYNFDECKVEFVKFTK